MTTKPVSKTKSKPARDINRIGRGKPGPGRPKGSTDKVTRDVKAMILGALEDQPGGGRQYLAEQARENPAAYLSLLGKIIPKDVAVTGGMQIQIVTGMDPALGEPGSN